MISTYANDIDDAAIMQTVTVSLKYRVVIPKQIRESMRLRPGQKLMVIVYDELIELIPDRDISEIKGFLKGIIRELVREDDRF